MTAIHLSNRKEQAVTQQQQAHWRYSSGNWEPIEDPVPGEDWNASLEAAGFYTINTHTFGYGEPHCFVVYTHREIDRWLVEINIGGDLIRLVEVTSFPDLIELTTKLAPLATAQVLSSIAEDLEDLISNAREDANRERQVRKRR